VSWLEDLESTLRDERRVGEAEDVIARAKRKTVK